MFRFSLLVFGVPCFVFRVGQGDKSFADRVGGAEKERGVRKRTCAGCWVGKRDQLDPGKPILLSLYSNDVYYKML